MPENNLETLRKHIIKELICGIQYDNSNHKLVFRRYPSLSIERMTVLYEVGKALGFEKWHVDNQYSTLNFSTDEMSDAKYHINSSDSKVGTVYYLECCEIQNGNLACLELMKMSESKMLVLHSDDKGLLPGDIIHLRNSWFRTDGTIEASVEDAPECIGKWFKSMPIKAIRVKIPSLVHEVADMIDSFDISLLSRDEVQDDEIDISDPVMGIIMGPHIRSLEKYLTISDDRNKAFLYPDGLPYEWKKGMGKWVRMKNT